MGKGSSGVLWVAGALGLAYWLYTQQSATTTTAPATPALPTPALPAQGTSITALPVATPAVTAPGLTSVTPAVLTTTALQIPVTATPGIPTAASTGLTASQLATLQNWAQTSMDAANYAQWTAQQGNFTPVEWAGLADLYFNDWTGGQGNTPARESFWNDWRRKYHILDGTYA